MSRLQIAKSWWHARRALTLSPDQLGQQQVMLWRKLKPVLARTPAYSTYVDKPFSELPIIGAASMRDDIGQWNSSGIQHADALAAAQSAEEGGSGIVKDDIVAGFSTGTSGQRGMFLASAAERSTQIGQTIARLLPAPSLLKGERISLILRANSAVYGDVSQGRFAFHHIPLGVPADKMLEQLNTFKPTILIAPPRELAQLAGLGQPLPTTLKRIFWGSEPIAPLERQQLSKELRHRIDPIYQATEGFIAAPCRYGHLHLNDDSFLIELERVEGTTAFRPIITDLMRTTQPMVRVRIDDLVRPIQGQCPCRSHRRLIEPVLGRVQDIWHLPGQTLTPEVVDNHFTLAMPQGSVWRIEGGPGTFYGEVVDREHAAPLNKAIGYLHPGAKTAIRPVTHLSGPKRRRITWKDAR